MKTDSDDSLDCGDATEEDCDRRWDAAFAASLDVLERLADEALADRCAGRTWPLDPDTL